MGWIDPDDDDDDDDGDNNDGEGEEKLSLIDRYIQKYCKNEVGDFVAERRVTELVLVDQVFAELDFVEDIEKCEESKKVAKFMEEFFEIGRCLKACTWVAEAQL